MLRPIVGSSSRPAVGSSLLWRGDRWGVASLLPCRPAHALSRLPYARHCTTSTTSSNAREEVKQPTVEQRQAASSAAPPSLKDVKPSRPQRRFHSRVIAVRLVKSYQHQRPAVRRTVEALGINRMHQIVYHKNIAPIRGQLNKIKHLITITPVPEPADYDLPVPEQAAAETVPQWDPSSMIYTDTSASVLRRGSPVQLNALHHNYN
ncbi:50S ribosomal protein L30 [Balamuthia mandrillaris]